MTARLLPSLVVAVAAALWWPAELGAQGAGAADGAPAAVSTPVSEAIAHLGAFDLATRTKASQTIRRAPSAEAVPALRSAAEGPGDEYVRYRALVLLTGFGDQAAAPAMRAVMDDRNDRLRTVAYQWFGQHPDPSIVPHLIAALDKESSEFVRPALLRALAAYGEDPRVRDVLAPLVLRGEDEFRGALIEALGDAHASYAVQNVAAVAKLDGPLQDDAIVALGEIGGDLAIETLRELQRHGPAGTQPSVAAALCLVDVNAAANRDYLDKSLSFAASTTGADALLQGAAHGLAVVAIERGPSAFETLLDVGVPSHDPARGQLGLAVGLVALRRPEMAVSVIEARDDRAGAITLLRDAFDMLSSEDYELEQFYVAARHAYWGAPAGSNARAAAEAVIDGLQF